MCWAVASPKGRIWPAGAGLRVAQKLLRALADISVAESGPISLAAEMLAVAQGVDYIRTHDARQLAHALLLRDLLGTNL